MRRHWRTLVLLPLPLLLIPGAGAQTPLNWEQVRERFRANNPSLVANRLSVDETKANEVTAGLRPNPQFVVVADQFRIFNPNPLRPFSNAQWTPTISQLFERRHKRELRVQSAEFATSSARTDALDQQRQLEFNLRDAFVRTLASKSILELSQDNLKYYDGIVRVNRERFKAGDISQADLSRIELQRAQYESDYATAVVNLRTAKIQLLQLMNEQKPVDSFDVAGDFDFKETILIPGELHRSALEARPDLASATTAIQKAEIDRRLAWANGSWDPIAGLEYQRSGSDHTAGLSLQLPIRIFDRNQGEKARAAIEIQRSTKLRESLVAIVLRDVDSAYETLESTRQVLRPYRDTYLPTARKVRDTISFSYQHGGASLLDFLDAQKSYRDTELAYRNLISSYLSAVNQLNLAVGLEVMQ